MESEANRYSGRISGFVSSYSVKGIRLPDEEEWYRGSFPFVSNTKETGGFFMLEFLS